MSFAALAGCGGPIAPDLTLRFKLNVELLVGGRSVSNSSIRELRLYFKRGQGAPILGSPGATAQTAEALTLDLGNGRFVFVMPESVAWPGPRRRSRGPWSPYGVLTTRAGRAPYSETGDAPIPGRDPAKMTYAEFDAILARGTLVLVPQELPMCVVFDKPAEEGTGRLVLPEEVPEIFSDVSFGRCSVERTETPAVRTREVQRALPWLDDGPGWATPRALGTVDYVVFDEFWIGPDKG